MRGAYHARPLIPRVNFQSVIFARDGAALQTDDCCESLLTPRGSVGKGGKQFTGVDPGCGGEGDHSRVQ